MDFQNLLSDCVKRIPPSGIRKYFDLLDDRYISLGVGEPDFPTPERIRAYVTEKLKSGRVAYTSNSGDPHLRELILKYLEERYAIPAYDSIDNILITVGASQAIDLAMRAILNPGDEVIVHEPLYVAYRPSVELAGGKAVTVVTRHEDRFRLRAEAVKAAITPKTKAILLAFPNNPTGAIMEKADLEAIADVVRDTDIIVVTDEIYAELTFNGKRHCSFAALPGMRDRTIVLNGFSKAFSMTGWRLGYAAGQKDIISAMRKVHQLTMLCAPTPAQWAGVAALETGFADDFADTRAMIDEYAVRRRFIIDAFNDMGLSCNEPEGAFYVFPSIRSTGLTSEQFCDQLLASKKIVTVPGSAFGAAGEGHIRCCYATSMQDIENAMRLIAEFLTEIR
ncbi:MAG TPA: aminotransferase class I/II-fold pyridoxal phosphate-dependent enzyme [Feifaniaceae bacterium]|nr:aminotransferase class I/II-fold pyridoxal phosphate-dependent enzyme [Feifaniaceae bacterium]